MSDDDSEGDEDHDLFDCADLEARDFSTDSVVMTTWHADEPLHVAMTLFFTAFPDQGKSAVSGSRSYSSELWGARLERCHQTSGSSRRRSESIANDPWVLGVG
jgi:hypothetical protein